MKYLLKSTSTRALLKGAVLRNCQTLKRGSFIDGEVNLYSSQLLERNIAKNISPAVSATVGLPGSVSCSVLMHNNIPIQKKYFLLIDSISRILLDTHTTRQIPPYENSSSIWRYDILGRAILIVKIGKV